MGLIARQTIKGTVYLYLSIIIGFVNVVLFMPQIFSTDEIGLLSLLVSISVILGQFGSLGFTNVTVRLFPYFRNHQNKHNGFLFLLLSAGSIGLIICSIIFFLGKDLYIASNSDNSILLSKYIFLLLPLIFISIFQFLLDTYTRSLFNASFGIFAKDFFVKFLNLVGIALYYLNVFDFHSFIIYYVISYGSPIILFTILLIYKGEFSLMPSFKILTPELRKQIFSVASFGLVASFCGIAILNIDKYFVNLFCSLSATGVYATCFSFGAIISLPIRPLTRISSSIIAENLKSGDYDSIYQIYKKSTLSSTIVSVFLFLIIWCNIDNIIAFLPTEFESGKYVILFISIANLMQAIASVSGEIIQFSNFYRQYTVIMVLFLIVLIGSYYIFLPKYGITGAGISYALAFLLYSIARLTYIWKKFNFQPFNIKYIIIITIGIAVYIVSSLIPQFNNIFIDSIVRSCIIVIIFTSLVSIFKVSPELNIFLENTLKFITKRK